MGPGTEGQAAGPQVLGAGDSKEYEPRRVSTGHHIASQSVMGPQMCTVHCRGAPFLSHWGKKTPGAAHQYNPWVHIQQCYTPVSGAEESSFLVCRQPDDGESGGQDHGPAVPCCPPTHARHSQHELNQPRDQHCSRDLKEERMGLWGRIRREQSNTFPWPHSHCPSSWEQVLVSHTPFTPSTEKHTWTCITIPIAFIPLFMANPRKRDWGTGIWVPSGKLMEQDRDPHSSTGAPTSCSESAQLPVSLH